MSTAEGQYGALRVAIDHDLCSGSAHCRDIAPGIFRIRDQRAWLAEDVRPSDADEDLLRQAEVACPWFAITVSTGDRPGGA